MAEQSGPPNYHAFGTFVTSAAEQPWVPKAGGSRSSRTLADNMTPKSITESDVKTNSGLHCARLTADLLLKHILSDSYNDYCVPAYITSICSGIEGMINELYIDFFHNRFGRQYRPLVNPFFRIPVKERISLIVPMLSDYKYQLNYDHDSFLVICRLFALRNSLVHVKHHWHRAKIIDYDVGCDIEYISPTDIDIYAKGIEKALTKEDFERFMRVSNEFLTVFVNLERRIKRKKFDPKNWFKPIKK